MPHLIKMLWGDVNATVKPTNRPAIEVEAIEYCFVAKWGKELIFFNEWQAVKNALAPIVEG